MKTVGFCALLVLLVYIPQIVAFHVFDVNFGISVYAVGVPRLIWLPEVLTKYLPFWLLFLIPNAMLFLHVKHKPFNRRIVITGTCLRICSEGNEISGGKNRVFYSVVFVVKYWLHVSTG